MANPIANIGTPGTGSYRVDWGPRQRGQEQAWKGISQLLHAVGEQGRKSAEQKSLAEVMAFVGDGQRYLTEGVKRGIPLPKLREAATVHRMLRPKTPETFETIQDPYGRGGVGQRSSRSGQISGYQGPLTPDKPTQRRIVKGADDLSYYEDDKTRVLPGVTATPKGDGAKPFETEQKLRKEYSDESDVFTKTQNSFRRVISSADGKSAAGDMGMIFAFMKTLDPGSVVRESEFALAASAGSFGEQIKAGVERVLTGQRLTPQQRADFVQTATRAYKGMADQQERRRVQYSNIAQKYGLDPSRALVDYLDMELLKRFAQPQGQPAPVREGNASDRFANNALARPAAECARSGKHDGRSGAKPARSRCGAKGPVRRSRTTFWWKGSRR